jgi:hypothetical protein
VISAILHVIPLAAFWSLIYYGRSDLQPWAIVAFILLWAGSLAAVFILHIPSVAFPAVESVLTAVLVLLVFGGDMKIR